MIFAMRTLVISAAVCLLFTLACFCGAAAELRRSAPIHHIAISVKYISGFQEREYHTLECLYRPRQGFLMFGSSREESRAGREPCPHCITGP